MVISNEADESLKDLPLSADLDTVFVEIAEEFDFDWPEGLAVERVHAGMAEIVVAPFVFVGLVVLAQQ